MSGSQNGQIVYTYPDGTQEYTRPSDGQVFIIFDKNQNPDFWQWDDFKGQWYNVTTHPLINSRIHIDVPKRKRLDTEIYKIKQCECGSEKVGSNNHSSWCPKH